MHRSQDGAFSSQVVVTTHSPHILYERGFKPIRYFRRVLDDAGQASEVLNLSAFYGRTEVSERDFLERYLKLTHCDLFFADAAILVEGNVERLLLPAMIENEAKSLRSACLSILEVGGAFGHRFKSLIEFLGLTALIITDIDSVAPVADPANADEDETEELEVPGDGEDAPKRQIVCKTCPADTEGALTANQTLIQWLPKKPSIAELHEVFPQEKIQPPTNETPAKVRVAYQVPRDVPWRGTISRVCGRTLEEAFGLENAAWCQAAERRHLGLKLRTQPATPDALAAALHKRVIGKSFDKTRFALAVLTEDPKGWVVPFYIKEALDWLTNEVALETEAGELGIPVQAEAAE